jgi:hypothetical protein
MAPVTETETAMATAMGYQVVQASRRKFRQ